MNKQWIYLTASGIVSKAPCLIYSITGNNNGTSGGYIMIYDGENTSEPVITKLGHVKFDSRQLRFEPPLKTKRGLYIDFTSQTESVLVCFAELDE